MGNLMLIMVKNSYKNILINVINGKIWREKQAILYVTNGKIWQGRRTNLMLTWQNMARNITW